MDLERNKLYKNINDLPSELSERVREGLIQPVPGEFVAEAMSVLGDEQEVNVTRDTEAGRGLLQWSKRTRNQRKRFRRRQRVAGKNA